MVEIAEDKGKTGDRINGFKPALSNIGNDYRESRVELILAVRQLQQTKRDKRKKILHCSPVFRWKRNKRELSTRGISEALNLCFNSRRSNEWDY